MDQITEKILAVVKDKLDASGLLDRIDKIYLFGSRARGDAEERSDIDLAISAENISKREWLDIVFALDDVETLHKIDVIHLDESSKELGEKVLSEGKIVYER